MTKKKGGFRDSVIISRKIERAQNRMDNIMHYIFRKILDEGYIFVTGTDDIIYSILCNEDIKIGVVVVQGEELNISNKKGDTEKLFMVKKDDNLIKYMDGIDTEKLVGLITKKTENSEINVIVVRLSDDEEFNMHNVGNLLFEIFPRETVKKSIEKIQHDLLNFMMVDGLIEMHNKKKR